ncbi:MAG: potassium transporter Kup [Rhodospirillales bacterium]|nr:potassium transporter Kup [Rhodospirillales bacterium]
MAAAARPAAWRLGTMVAVLGVVYGDIGTSPLYTMHASLALFAGGRSGPVEVLGILSLVFWALVLIVTVKYVLLVMRADNHGEGGILALMALAQRVSPKAGTRAILAVIGITGACLLFGDGLITPAISVLSAVEGLDVTAPSLREYDLPIAVVVIIALFAIQSRGTGRIGRLFGPVMVLWFAAIGVAGAAEIARNPGVLLAFSPHYGVRFCLRHGWIAFVSLGAVVLAVTGAEALYADMGHFGPRPIRRTWLAFVLPALLLNYFGQGALLLREPKALANPFFLLVPHVVRLPMVVLATVATVIASQALISGAFSLARQCVQLGFLPRITVRHTSSTEEGQIYAPQVNSALAVGVLLLVLSFRTSDNLAAAYGIAVTGTFICTALLAMVVFRRQFGWTRAASAGVFGFFLVIDSVFFAANMLKLPEGGWVPLVLAAALMGLMNTWKRGRDLLFARWRQDSLPLASFLARLPASRIVRVPGIAVFLTGNPDFVPSALLHNLKHNKVLHEKVLLVTVNTLDVPEVEAAERAEVKELSPGIFRVGLRYGFMESPNIPRALEALRSEGIGFDPMQVSYFLGRELLVPATVPKMPFWRLWLFLVMARNAVPATEFFRIPADRVVELGVRVAI